MAQQPLVGKSLLIIRAARSLSVRHITLGETYHTRWDTSHSVRHITLGETHHPRWDTSHSVRHITLGETHHTRWDTSHSVGILWKSDQPDAENSTLQHPQAKDIRASGGIRTRNPIKRAAAYPRLRSRGHWDRLLVIFRTNETSPVEHKTQPNTFKISQITRCILKPTLQSLQRLLQTSAFQQYLWHDVLNCLNNCRLKIISSYLTGKSLLFKNNNERALLIVRLIRLTKIHCVGKVHNF
jgi:hypothetical protein